MWSVTVRLLGLPNSFPSQAPKALRCNRSAAPDPNVRSKRKKKQHRDMEGVFGEGWESSDYEDVSEESVISVEELPELQTHLQSRTITPLS